MPRSKARPATTLLIPRPQVGQVPGRKVMVQQASQEVTSDDSESDEAAKNQSEDKSDEVLLEKPPENAIKPTEESKSTANPQKTTRSVLDDPNASIGATVMGNEIILTGPDSQSLDELEDLITTLIEAIPQRTRWTVFYLKTADATETAQMIERLFPQSSVTTTTPSSSDGGFFGSFTNGLSRLGSGMMNATGLNQTLGGSQNLRVITDVRANALFVTGPPEVVRDVEYMLELLDASELPPSLRDRVPQWIPVEYADIDEVAEIIESVFKDAMTVEPQQNPQQMNPFAMMMGGGNRNAQAGKKQQGPELTLGIDRRTSNLVVSCNDTMFRRVEQVVKTVDQRAKDARRTVRIVPLTTADPTVVQSTLTSLMPKVSVSATRPKSRKTNDPSAGGNPNQGPDPAMMQRAPAPGGGRNGGGPQFGPGGGQFGGGFPGGGGNFQGGGGNRNNGGGGRGGRGN